MAVIPTIMILYVGTTAIISFLRNRNPLEGQESDVHDELLRLERLVILNDPRFRDLPDHEVGWGVCDVMMTLED